MGRGDWIRSWGAQPAWARRGDRAATIMDSIVVCQVIDMILVELADFVSDTSDFASDTSDFVSDF